MLGKPWLIAVMLAVGSALLTAGLWAPARALRPQDVAPRVVNRTSTLQVVGAVLTPERPAPTMKLTLRNTSDKNVRAYTVAQGDSWITTDYAFSLKSLHPGETTEDVLPVAEAGDGKIAVTAVYFDDGTGEGDPRYVYMLRERYAGFGAQARRILPHLNGLLRSNRPLTDEDLAALESEVARLPAKESSPERSADFRSALHLFKQDAAQQMSKIKRAKQRSGESAAREKLDRAAAAYGLLVGN